ncbi:MAG: sortase, partial [Chloroflexota bacterium]
IDPGTGYTVGVPASATGTITNDDATPFPSLGLIKTDGVASVIAGGTTTYSLTVSNVGNAATSGTITIVDVLPTGLSIADGTVTLGGVNAAVWSCISTSNIITCVSNTAIAATNGTSVFSFTVNVAVNASGTLLNKAQVGGGGDPLTSTPTSATTSNCSATDTPTQGCAIDSNTWTPQADLTLTKTVDNPSPKVGDNVTYTLTLTNNGPSNATNVTVADTLPVGLNFVSATPSSGTSFTAPTWTIPSLTANSSATLQLTATVSQVGTITNFAQVTASDQPDPDSTPNNGPQTPREDDEASVDIGGLFDPPTAIKTFNDANLPELEFRMVWINSGNAVAVNVQVTDDVPVGTTFVPGSLTCVPASVNSSTNPANATAPLNTTLSSCAFDASVNGGRGRVQWQGILGPDNGHLTEAAAVNEMVITFRVTVNNNVNQVLNEGASRTDTNGNTAFVDETTSVSLSSTNQVVWNRSIPVAAPVSVSSLPATGFAPNVVTKLMPQPRDLAYAATDLVLEIPSLGVKISIVGIPKKAGAWDVSWLGKQAGWLAGTAFPSWKGNSVLTGHVYDANGLPGPFVNLNKLKYGDKFIIHAYGQKYTFEVRTNQVVDPSDLSSFKHEEKSWLTLITCKEYDAKTNTYKQRVVVRAVLVSVDWDK